MLCTDLTFVKDDQRGLYARPIKCNRWSCDYCRPLKMKRLMAIAFSGQPNTFLTLTVSDATAETPDLAAKVLVVAWRKVRAEACKRYGYDTIPFVAVFEATKKGQPHLHILLRCPWLDQKWLVARMNFHAKAPIVWIKRIDNLKTMIGYLVKYIGKAPHGFGTTKRYWTSRNWELGDGKPEPSDRSPFDRCRVAFRRFSLYVMDREREGYSIEWDGDGVWLRWALPGPGPPGEP